MTVALVTGGGNGIGRAACVLFARDGAQVVVADVNEAAAQETVELVLAAGGDAIACAVDVSDAASVEAMVARAVAQYGSLDAAFNNAGISPAAKPFTEHTAAEWQRVIDVNLTGVFFCLQQELRQMVAQGTGGAIVNTSSGAGVVAAPGQPQYTAAKHAVLGLTKSTAQEYARNGIRVNAILPGMTDTAPMREYLGDNNSMVRMLPAGRMATPEEIAESAVWLCSSAASYVSGASLVVDGGLLCR
ncbi:MAG: short-chain dehydrogenase/reductase [Actinomycetia bacterium]|jgi:NAD(P)-dependent dehydrogenase (short-subunit alcohol dehydrogenase family)|nr:short-chain dehydrogenase/reductase [Actinomycetes bacterium]